MSVMGLPFNLMYMPSMSPQVLGKAISTVWTENAAHYLQSLILQRVVISIDPAQRDRSYPPQKPGYRNSKVLTFVPDNTKLYCRK